MKTHALGCPFAIAAASARSLATECADQRVVVTWLSLCFCVAELLRKVVSVSMSMFRACEDV